MIYAAVERRITTTLASMKLVITVYIAAILGAEDITLHVGFLPGITCHAAIILALLNHYVWLGQAAGRQGLLSLVLLPLLRILSITMPVQNVAHIYWFALIGLPLLLSAALMVRLLGLTWSTIGCRTRSWASQCLIATSAVPLSIVGFTLIRPSPLITAFDWHDLAVGALILTIFVGFSEELLFRGILQQVLTDVFGKNGLLVSSVIYAVMNVGSTSFSYVVFMGLVGLLFGWCVYRTHSLLGVVAAHSGLAIGMACVWPFLLHHGPVRTF